MISIIALTNKGIHVKVKKNENLSLTVCTVCYRRSLYNAYCVWCTCI